MVTEPIDPAVDVWSNQLEEDMVEAGLEPPQAKAFARAFELGMTRVMSVMATKQELRDGLNQLRQEMRRELEQLRGEQGQLRGELAQLRQQIADIQLNYATKQDLKEAIDGLRSEMRFLLLLGFGIATALLSALIAIVA